MPMTADRETPRRDGALMRSPFVYPRSFCTGVNSLDGMAPNGAFQKGAVHELLFPQQSILPTSLTLLLARSALATGGAIAWLDPAGELYLPAASAAGIDLHRLILLRCRDRHEQLWALAECLRCRAIAAAVAPIEQLNPVEARRLQLAAERGGGVGLFMRSFIPGISHCYAAATRWLIQPVPGDDQVQRWSVQLLHGHGGQIGQVLQLEVDRETRQWRASPLSVRTFAPLADRPAAPAPARASA